jgi:hypothetical protein
VWNRTAVVGRTFRERAVAVAKKNDIMEFSVAANGMPSRACGLRTGVMTRKQEV